MVSNYDRIFSEITTEAQRLAPDHDIDPTALVNLAMEIVDLEDQHRLNLDPPIWSVSAAECVARSLWDTFRPCHACGFGLEGSVVCPVEYGRVVGAWLRCGTVQLQPARSWCRLAEAREGA